MWDRSKLIINLSILVLIGFAIYNIWVPRLRGADDFFSYLSYPNVQTNNSIKNWFDSTRDWIFKSSDLQKYASDLQDQVDALQAENIALRAKGKYWQNTKEIIDFGKRYKYTDKILAQVFFKYLKPQEQCLLLNKGMNDGVERGMVAVYKNCLLGKVGSVYPQYCRLVLLTDKTCKIAVSCTKTGAVGICRGLNDKHKLALNYVSHLQKLKEGDKLISSGEGEIFPQGFGVGNITDFTSDGMYYRAYAKPLVDIGNIKYCYLIDANKG